MAPKPVTDTPTIALFPQDKVGLLLRVVLDTEGDGTLTERDAATLAIVEENLARESSEDRAR